MGWVAWGEKEGSLPKGSPVDMRGIGWIRERGTLSGVVTV
jgi:hypothetical protein